MTNQIKYATVTLWDHHVGVVAWDSTKDVGLFEYEPRFLRLGLDISPIKMPIKDGGKVYSFPNLNTMTYFGLPGLLADALPDKFGNALIDSWLARQGRSPLDFSPIERLCYIGKRGMGALEFEPIVMESLNQSEELQVSELTEMAQIVMNSRGQLDGMVGHSDSETKDTILDILRVGTSAGGARPKAVIAMDEKGNVRSGQCNAPDGYSYWILKFDGVYDLELGQPKEYGRLEYAYYLMAKSAGIEMSESRLLQENGRAHFITKRFDRYPQGKRHMQSLSGMAHYDYNAPGSYSYEQVFQLMRTLQLSKNAAVQFFRRMVFNVVAANLDDHTKNIAFLMDTDGVWQLSPAYDVIFAHNPKGQWTHQHQMTIAGKRHSINKSDLLLVADVAGISEASAIIDEVIHSVSNWPNFAAEAGLNPARISEVAQFHQLKI